MKEYKKKTNRVIEKKASKKSSITDWISAIMAILGTLFALVGLILAWLSLSNSDKDLQRQIDKLDIVANQSLEHTKILTEQLELIKEDLDFQKQQNELSHNLRQTEIEPKLILEFYSFSGDLVKANLINNGKIAKILKVEENLPNDFLIDIPYQFIGEGKEKEITFRLKNSGNGIGNIVLNFTLYYQDIDKKNHSMNFYINDIEEIFAKMDENRIITG